MLRAIASITQNIKAANPKLTCYKPHTKNKKEPVFRIGSFFRIQLIEVRSINLVYNWQTKPDSKVTT